MLGGKIRTERVDGFVVEAAPDSFLTRKERGVGLCEELGLGDELIARRPEHRGSFVRRGDRAAPASRGPHRDDPDESRGPRGRASSSPPRGKARFAAEPDVPPAIRRRRRVGRRSFVSRRFGREAYDALVEPLMTGIYGGDGDQLSLQATFPQLRALELEHGSVLRGLSAPPVSDRPPFVSLRGGMGALVDALSRRPVADAATYRARCNASRAPRGRLRRRARRGRDDPDERRRPRDARVRRRRTSSPSSTPELAEAHAADPVRVVRRRDTRVLARRRRAARRVRLRGAARRGRRRARLHVVVAEVGAPGARGGRAPARLHGTLRSA